VTSSSSITQIIFFFPEQFRATRQFHLIDFLELVLGPCVIAKAQEQTVFLHIRPEKVLPSFESELQNISSKGWRTCDMDYPAACRLVVH